MIGIRRARPESNHCRRQNPFRLQQFRNRRLADLTSAEHQFLMNPWIRVSILVTFRMNPLYL